MRDEVGEMRDEMTLALSAGDTVQGVLHEMGNFRFILRIVQNAQESVRTPEERDCQNANVV